MILSSDLVSPSWQTEFLMSKGFLTHSQSHFKLYKLLLDVYLFLSSLVTTLTSSPAIAFLVSL
jgi:hypothetical protein